MSREADARIGEILSRYGEPFAGNVWRVQGTAVLYHKTLERIAAQAKITFDPPTIIRAERDEAVVLVIGRMGERVEWSFGEALIGSNYRVSGRQAAYVWAMSEKRAKDRVILKLIELSGLVYSEDESDDFKQANADKPAAPSREASGDGDPSEIEKQIRAEIERADSINAVTDLMLAPETQEGLASLAPGIRDDVRECAKNRLRALGWPPAKKERRAAA
jgi:hypothetical protein